MYNNGNSSKNVTGASVVDGTIANADIDSSAAIAQSKLATLVITDSEVADDELSGNKIDGGTISNFASTGIDDNATETAITIDASEKVGVGTSSPDALLEVAGTTNDALFNLTGAGTAFELRATSGNGATSNSSVYRLALDYLNGAWTNGFIDFYRGGAGNNGYLAFGSSGTERMRIDSSGNTHFGRTSTGWYTSGVSLATGGSSIYTEFIRTHTSDASANIYLARANNGNMLGFYRNDGGSLTAVGSVSVTASATAYNTSSDYRLKENVVPMTGSIDRLKALKPSKFNFIVDPDTTVDGFLAHEAQEVVPEAITGIKDAMSDIGSITDAEGIVIKEEAVEPVELEEGQTWTKTGETIDAQSIDQSKLVPLLVSALQEAIARIETLENA